MKSKFGLGALALAAALAAGCASTKDEAPVEVVDTTPAPAPAPTSTPVSVAQGPVAGTLDDFRVNVGEKVFFDVDRYNLSEAARATLAKQAEWLNTYGGVKILVAGNCDERGTREYNIALGERRAAAARDYLISLGVDASRIETVSYGKDRPTDPRSTPEGWAVNRNAHTQLVSGVTG